MAYRERQASAAQLRPWVQCVWSVRTDGADSVLPDGCMDVIWTGERQLVAGPDTGANRSGVPAAGLEVVGVRFRPGAGGAALGLPASELRDARLDLEDLWGAPARELAERMALSGGDARLLEDAVVARVTPLDPLLLDAAARVAGGAPVAEVARSVALSERQLPGASITASATAPRRWAG
jgi:hypothetical protein